MAWYRAWVGGDNVYQIAVQADSKAAALEELKIAAQDLNDNELIEEIGIEEAGDVPLITHLRKARTPKIGNDWKNRRRNYYWSVIAT